MLCPFRCQAASAEHEHVMVGRRIERLARLGHDERTVQAGRQLTKIVQVGVIDERPGARRRETNDEGAARIDHRRDPPMGAAPSVHAVVKAVELDTVPVNGGGFGETVDQRDLHGLASAQHDRRAGNVHRAGRWWHGAFAEHEPRVLHHERQLPRQPIVRVVFSGRLLVAAEDGDAHQHSRHAAVRPVIVR